MKTSEYLLMIKSLVNSTCHIGHIDSVEDPIMHILSSFDIEYNLIVIIISAKKEYILL